MITADACAFLATRAPPSADLDKIHDALDVLQDLLFRFVAFGGLRRQPSAAGRKQVFKGVADQGIGIKVSGAHTKSSAITIRGRLIVAANGVAHAHKQGLQQKPLSRGHRIKRRMIPLGFTCPIHLPHEPAA